MRPLAFLSYLASVAALTEGVAATCAFTCVKDRSTSPLRAPKVGSWREIRLSLVKAGTECPRADLLSGPVNLRWQFILVFGFCLAGKLQIDRGDGFRVLTGCGEAIVDAGKSPWQGS